jgi:hypothetical protein
MARPRPPGVAPVDSAFDADYSSLHQAPSSAR